MKNELRKLLGFCSCFFINKYDVVGMPLAKVPDNDTC